VKDSSHAVIWREGEEKGVRGEVLNRGVEESRWERGIILP
jgi:hypothetical protein